MTLYHGSDQIIEKPVFRLGKVQNDYGLGFYCTEHAELAKEWACGELKDGFTNEYEIDLKGLKVIDLNGGDFTIVDRLAVLVANGEAVSHRFDVSPPSANVDAARTVAPRWPSDGDSAPRARAFFSEAVRHRFPVACGGSCSCSLTP